jgi:hypothetical protein
MMALMNRTISMLVASVCVASVPSAAFSAELVQLRTLGTGSSTPSTTTVGGTGSTVSAWQPVNANGRIDVNPANYPTLSSTTNTPLSTTGAGTTYRSGISVVAANQKMTVRLNERISSQDSKAGDTVSATLESPITNGMEVIAPAGSEVLGSIVESSAAKRAGIHGEVDLHFYTVVKPNGERIALDAIVVTKHGGSTVRPNNYAVDAARGVGIAAAGTGAGALTGLALGGIFSAAGSGAALGTAVGGAAGIGYALWRKGKGIELPKGALLQLQTIDPATNPNAQAI